MILFEEFLHQLKFQSFLSSQIKLSDQRAYCTYPKQAQVPQMLRQLVLGYATDDAATRLSLDPVLSQPVTSVQWASQPSQSRFLNGLTQADINQLVQLAQILAERSIQEQVRDSLIIDIDSTHSDNFGRQEQTDYNAHYRTMAYHPLLAIDVVSGLVLGAELRPGNVYTSSGVSDFLRPIIDRYQDQANCLIRGDSGFATPKVYNLCDGDWTHFLIRLKTNARLTRLAESRILYGNETDFTRTDCQYHDCLYQANTWDKPLRVIIKSTRSVGALFYRYEFLVTSLKELSPQWLYRFYQQRGQMENHIKEVNRALRLIKRTAPHSSPIAPECF